MEISQKFEFCLFFKKLRLFLKKRYRHFKIFELHFLAFSRDAFFLLCLPGTFFLSFNKGKPPNLGKWWLFQILCPKCKRSYLFGRILRIAWAKLILAHSAWSGKRGIYIMLKNNKICWEPYSLLNSLIKAIILMIQI